MLHAPEFRSRIRELLPAAAELHAPESDLIRLLSEADETESAVGFLVHVEDMAKVILAELIEQGLGEGDVDAIVDGALRHIHSRPLLREMNEIDDRVRFVPEAEKSGLLRRKIELNSELRKLNTNKWKRTSSRR